MVGNLPHQPPLSFVFVEFCYYFEVNLKYNIMTDKGLADKYRREYDELIEKIKKREE